MSAALRFAEAYAEHMDGWSARGVYDSASGDLYDHMAVLVGPDDVQLNVRAGQHDIRGRVKLSVRHNLPPGAWYDIQHPSITVAETRNPADAARYILRALVPDAIAATTHSRKLVQASRARAEQVQSLSARLLAEFPDLGPHGIADRDQERRTLSWSPKGNGYGEVTINYGANSGEVHLRSLSVEQLVLVLQALKTASKEG